MALQPGAILNQRYRIEETIAQGGMGAVYRALDTVLNIQVAVKENFQNSDQFNRQFRLEATILAGLNHPNLPRVTDHFSLDGNHLYLVMDYVDGIDLRTRIAAEGQLSEAEVLHIGETVCEALSYLHSRQPEVVHRDVKPGNIKITSAGQIFLVDFGLAKLDSAEKTTTGAQAFTPGYSPPEQYGSRTETRSDIYSLGGTLYAALTGKIPQDGLERAMGTCELTPILHHNPSVTIRTAEAIEKAMSVHPEDRFPSAENFRTALISCRTALPMEKRTNEVISLPKPRRDIEPTIVVAHLEDDHDATDTKILTSKPASDRPKRTPFLILGLVLGLFLFIVCGTGIFLSSHSLQPEPLPKSSSTPTRLPSATAPLATDDHSESSGILSASDTPTLTPSLMFTATATPEITITPTIKPSPTVAVTQMGGSTGMITFSSARSGSTQIWLTGFDMVSPTQVTDLSDGACEPDWSPEGARVVFVSPCSGRQEKYPGSSLYIINADGTGLTPLATLPGGDYDPAWSPDGKKIAFTSLRSGRENIYLYDLASSTVTRISSPVNVERRPAWSPDGSMIAYETHRNGPSQIWVMNATGQNMREFSKIAAGDSFMPTWAPDDPANSGKGLLVFCQGSQSSFLTGQEFKNPAASEFHLTEKIRGGLDPRFSPDGWWLAFTMPGGNETSGIAMIQRNGGGLTLVPGTLPGDFHPSWRPAKATK